MSLGSIGALAVLAAVPGGGGGGGGRRRVGGGGGGGGGVVITGEEPVEAAPDATEPVEYATGLLGTTTWMGAV